MAVQVRGLDLLQKNLKSVADIIPSGDLMKVLEEAGEVLVEEVQKNILEQDLVKTGKLFDSIKAVTVGKERVDIVAGTPYAAVHEFGLPKGGKGIFSATAKQIRFFWAKWAETGNVMWKALALKKGYTIPPRPYMTPAVRTAQPDLVKALAIALANKLLRRVKS